MNIQRIIFYHIDGNRPFCYENGILCLENLGIMSFYHPLVDGIGDFYIVRGRSKTPRIVKVQTIPVSDTVVIVDTGLFHKISLVVFSIEKTTFAVNFILFSRNC